MNPKLWPNLLSGARIALMPAVLLVAMAGSRRWFLILVAASLATDALDGFLARRLNAFSDFGRKLDSAADYLTMMTGLAGIALLWPDIVRRELPWIVAGLSAFFGVIVFGFVRLGHPPCYHTWAAKAGVAGCALSMIPLLTGWSAVPFHCMVTLQILAAVEEVIISLLIPRHAGEMATVWHALRLRRENAALKREPHPVAPVHR
ncbi:MAG: CDP-alcohol phosphatidyltransferase family protein [Opitutaceae bacterium]